MTQRDDDSVVVANPWQRLRELTDARIGLGRSGGSLTTRAQLAFQLDHARARDAVHMALDTERMMPELDERFPLALRLHSRAADRDEYLRRPDLGRQLSETAAAEIGALNADACDVSICIVDGLSARAIHEQAIPFLEALAPEIESLGLTLGPVALVEQGRVAIGDPIGEALGARMSVVMIGERPGLSSPDSLGLYFTWAPRTGRRDSERNCISNVRPRGLSYRNAAKLLAYLMREAQVLGASGVALKDDSEVDSRLGDGRQGNFLLPPQA
ncbi:ethanolamine ammonia-lyase subunit EutC [Salinicola rhizosphaerae]|uniref:Ethanolamine ammonia-lyase small subunit n=1 Tax=Salinicola rhizosphaerae TaxID=1443141 RepID=A0ABQ3DT26_9GAMM|nr:ethanolamine ammonia-lyase subunit EutC [Salinicola rhizosphaerae]GHB12051.1 ethanolamine ammonia-lyase light chain [Salinicola rhizosphaerae]